jgi:High potential iron-sulfur protein
MLTRRRLLRSAAAAVSLVSVASVRLESAKAADAQLLSVDDPAAKAVKYVEDATKAKRDPADSTCANCGLYQGKTGDKTGPCQLFPKKNVVAAGWCSSWAPQM